MQTLPHIFVVNQSRSIGWALVIWPLLLLGCTLFTDIRWGVGFLLLAASGLYLLTQPWWCAVGIALFLHTGVLTSFQTGFTLKAPQAFALLGSIAIFVQLLDRRQKCPIFSGWPWFIFFFLMILPSLWQADIYGLDWGSNHTSLRLLFNYAWLYLISGVLWFCASSKERLLRLTQWSLLSCLLSMVFGVYQQVGYYQGWYDPYLYLSKHSSIVDFYGPFLRFSPGTFANEYGEVLQSTGILLVGVLLMPRWSRWQRMIYSALLMLVALALIVNFTRASWLVLAVGIFVLLMGTGVNWLRLGLWGCLLSSAVYGLFQMASQITLLSQTLMLSVGQRIQELSDISTLSAGQRLVAWHDAWTAFLIHPLVGNGWGSYISTHNVPLQLLAEVGLLGFFAFYGLMGWISWAMWKGWKQSQDQELKILQFTYMVAFWGCLVFDMTNHGIFHFVLWWNIAMGLATARIIENHLGFESPIKG